MPGPIFIRADERELSDWKTAPDAMRKTMDTTSVLIMELKAVHGLTHEEACRMVCQEATKWWQNTQPRMETPLLDDERRRR